MAAKRPPTRAPHRNAAGSDPLLDLCRSLPAITEDVKWGHDLIFSVGGKMFAGFQLPDHEPLAFKTDRSLLARA